MPDATRPSVPRIFYCTRTHSQIAQVSKELKNTAYRPKTAILASKAHYCVEPNVCKAENKSVDEGCEEKLDSEAGCKFKDGTQKLVGAVEQRLSMKVRPSCLCSLCQTLQAASITPSWSARVHIAVVHHGRSALRQRMMM